MKRDDPGAARPGDEWVWVPFEVDRRFDGLRVDVFLARRLAAYSRTRIQKLLAGGRGLREGRKIRASSKTRSGDKIWIAYPRRPEAPLPADAALPVLYEDEHLLLINKPAGLLCHPTDKIAAHTVLGYLKKSRPGGAPVHLLHRLDRETSGVLALAKSARAARDWGRAMERREVKKEYAAFVRGAPEVRKGILTWPIGRQGGAIKVRQWINVPGAVSARTRYALQKTGAGFSLANVFPETGRLHQIRVHFAALGHPLLGDPLYTGAGEMYQKMVRGLLTDEDRARLGFPRVALHAAALTFLHPVSRRTLRVEAPLPDDMANLLHF